MIPMDFITQNILLISLVVVSGLGLAWPFVMRPSGNSVNPAEATLLINRENAIIIDVREVQEFAAGHLPAARNIPAGKLQDSLADLESCKNKPVIVTCASGMRAGRACGELKKHGFSRLYNLAGGVDAWVGAGYPIKKGAKV